VLFHASDALPLSDFFFFSNYKFQLFLNFDFRFVLKDFIGIIDRAKVFSLN